MFVYFLFGEGGGEGISLPGVSIYRLGGIGRLIFTHTSNTHTSVPV